MKNDLVLRAIDGPIARLTLNDPARANVLSEAMIVALLEHRIGHVSDSVFDGIVQPLEFGFCLGRTLAQFGHMHRGLRTV